MFQTSPFVMSNALVLILSIGLAGTVFADGGLDLEMNRRAIAILNRECVACHGADKQEGNLRLDTRSHILAGGDHGPAFSPSSLSSSLADRIEHSDPELRMPPKRALSAIDVATLRKWMAQGAHWPSDSPPTPDAAISKTYGDAWSDNKNPIRVLFGGKRLDLWSLKPIVKPRIPSVVMRDWCSNPIDCFVLSEWERRGLGPAPSVSDRLLAKRLSLDLIGLPPSYADVEEFANSNEPDKVAQWIDRDLESPSLGVHWARMWLDVIRYSDSNGFDWDELRPDAWRYRDYVVRSLNRDIAYDRFIEQQIAGDELLAGPPRNADEQDCLIATGYLRLGPQDNAASLFNEQDRARAELMSDLTETTGSAMLGLTFSCCRCHDHKTDPLSQEDHYRFRAFFAACHYPEEPAIDLADIQAEIRLHNAALDESINRNKEAIAELTNSVLARQGEEVDKKKLKEFMTADERERLDRLETENKRLAKAIRPYTKALLMTDNPDSVAPTFVFAQGDHHSPRQVVEPGFPSVLFPNKPNLIALSSRATTGRRLTLARWITSTDNPWTARVIVNRIWQNYFGRGIVSTPNDFGITGAPPTHPELLDYLASELIEHDWSLKHIHRLIATSSCYRQQAVSVTADVSDVEIISLRTDLRRLSAEQLRDALLQTSGLLQERAGGPAIWPEVDAQTLAANPAVLDENETKTKGWYPSPKSTQTVRSLYLIQKRTIRIPWLETFDLPENAVSCGRRDSSIVAPQSLTLMNGELSSQAAHSLAEAATRAKIETPEEVVRFAYTSILQRLPNRQELDACVRFLETRTIAELSLVLINCNEFVFID